MSSISAVEKSSRSYYAMSVLNRLRHWIDDRAGSQMSNKDREILSESLSFKYPMRPEVIAKAIIYNLRSCNDKEMITSFQIGEILRDVFGDLEEEEHELYLNALKNVIVSVSKEDIDKNDIIKAKKISNEAIRKLGELSEGAYSHPGNYKDL